ncbi:ABC transporter ATP-binding protein [Chryseolinea sp. H1M3-3]|uniref:ABC transporter ATP-binding protein n=1 Tax=Chryseolinea sp. H1M3-3 TaxID=3034144 RepID=UPI0023EB9FA1|nr:ABC transporter ATP-binding protein [Chryseolinea sp. H1M3-3]
MTSSEKSSVGNIEIIVKDLGKRFNREWIFRNLNYKFEPANVYAITGPNGSGKSTLLQVLWGQLPQSKGELKYKNASHEIPVEEIYRHLAIATPYLDLIEEFTLLEHLRFHFKMKRSRNNMDEHEILDKMQLTKARDKHIANFSSGMKQRVKLALAFFTQADLIFLDEPTTNLDSNAASWYHEQLKGLPLQCTIFIASNQASEYPQNAKILNILDLK